MITIILEGGLISGVYTSKPLQVGEEFAVIDLDIEAVEEDELSQIRWIGSEEEAADVVRQTEAIVSYGAMEGPVCQIIRKV